MSLPDSIGVNVTLSVIKTGPQHSASISSIKDVTSFVKAEQRIIGMPVIAGKDGAKGADGESATVTIGTVETLPPGSNAYVRNSGTETDAVLDIGIPRGEQGSAGVSSWGDITGTLSDQTDLANALAMKANVADLGDLAYEDDAPSDNAEYVRKNGSWAVSSGGGGTTAPAWGAITGTLSQQTDLQNALNAKANTADLGALADHDTVDYATEVTNKPSLGTMASVNDAPSDSKEYVRKNGAWAESSGGGGGGGTPTWGSITGTMSQQTDLQTALDEKAPVIIDRIPVTKSGVYVVVSRGEEIIDLKATYNVTQTGSGTPSASNIRPFVSTEKAIVMLAVSYAVLPPEYISQNIQLPSTIYGGIVDVINGELTITHGHIASYNGETLSGVWYSDRDEYVAGTTPTVGAEVVYELETPAHQSFTGRTPSPFQSRDTYMWVTHAQNIETNYTVTAVVSNEGAVDTKTYIDQNDALKANVADLGDLAYEDDAPSDNAEYVRKNGSWAVSSGGGTTAPVWGDISGTLSNQTDLANALVGKQNVLTFDATPTVGSTNPVESGGVKTALDAKQDTLTFDSTPTAESTNPVTSSGVYDAIVEGFRDVYKVTLPSASSSKLTFSAPGITANHVLCVEGHAYYSNPSAVMSDLSITTAANSITITGTLSGTTDIIVTLGIPRTITAS